MTEHDHGGPKKADETQDQETITPEPVHRRSISRKCRSTNDEGSPNAQMTKALQEMFCHSGISHIAP
jgi:hypothetical protein